MTVLTITATEREIAGQSVGFGGGGVKARIATTELAAASSASTVALFTIPSNARILQMSKLYWDDLATSGSPTLDIGLFPVNGNVTADDDCLNDGLALSAVSAAGVGSFVVKDFANAGKRAYEYLGLTVDPRGDLIVKATVRDAATTATGTITAELLYTLN